MTKIQTTVINKEEWHDKVKDLMHKLGFSMPKYSFPYELDGKNLKDFYGFLTQIDSWAADRLEEIAQANNRVENWRETAKQEYERGLKDGWHDATVCTPKTTVTYYIQVLHPHRSLAVRGNWAERFKFDSYEAALNAVVDNRTSIWIDRGDGKLTKYWWID